MSDTDVASWYQANQARVQGAPLDQVQAADSRPISRRSGCRASARQYLDSLKAKTSVRVMLDPPRQTVATANSPGKGPANAPIEIIEFSDFQCPFCLRADPTVNRC